MFQNFSLNRKLSFKNVNFRNERGKTILTMYSSSLHADHVSSKAYKIQFWNTKSWGRQKKIVVAENTKCNELGSLWNIIIFLFLYFEHLLYILYSSFSTQLMLMLLYCIICPFFILERGLDLIAVVLLLDMKVIWTKEKGKLYTVKEQQSARFKWGHSPQWLIFFALL